MDRSEPPAHSITTKLDKDIMNGQGDKVDMDEAAHQEYSRKYEILARLDSFGLWLLSIQESAELIACDMWASGEIEIEELDDYRGQLRDPEVKNALADVISKFVTRLTNAIELGRLKAEYVRRDFEENIIPSETFIGVEPLEEWVNARGYSFGDAFTEWEEEQTSITDRIIDEVVWLRSVKEKNKITKLMVGFTRSRSLVDESCNSDLLSAYKSALSENEHLRERLAKAESTPKVKAELPVSAKHRSTLLTLIGALCDHAGIDVGMRGVAQRIMEMTEKLGAPVDDETIRKVLASVPDALERRSR